MVDQSLSKEISRLSERITKDPSSRLFVPLADAYLKSNLPDEAISVLTEGIKNNPTFVAGRVLLGKTYREKKAFSEAKAQFEEVMRINSENIPSLRNLAAIYREEGDDRQALVAYQDILSIDPSDKEAQNSLSNLQKKVDPRPFEEEFAVAEPRSEPEPAPDKTLEEGILEPTSLEIPEKVTIEADRANSLAIETGLAVHEDEDADPIATPTLATLYMDQGSYREAADIYRKLLEKDAADIESRQGLESALARLGSGSKSEVDRGKTSRNDRKIARLQSWLAAVKKEKKR